MMESLDLLGLLEALYDFVEKRFGKLAAWLVTISLTVGLGAIAVLFLERML
jgi:uncharacterized membrane protein YuzA (DUF378 family)